MRSLWLRPGSCFPISERVVIDVELRLGGWVGRPRMGVDVRKAFMASLVHQIVPRKSSNGHDDCDDEMRAPLGL
jgi:hypothetical protein